MEFPAKVDWWFQLLFYGLGILMLLGAPLLIRVKGALGTIILAVVGVLFVAIGWQTNSVTYVITEDAHLVAKGGYPLNGYIADLRTVQRIEPSDDPRSSHAASLDRLRIDYGCGGLIFIAVHDKPAFLDAVVKAEPTLKRTATGVIRP